MALLLGASASIAMGCGNGASSPNDDRDAHGGDVTLPESSADDVASSPIDSSSDAGSLPDQASRGDAAGDGVLDAQRDAPIQEGSAADANGSVAEGGPDLGKLHTTCMSGMCPSGLSPVMYYGIAGPGGPQFCSCEIPCNGDGSACPQHTACGYIADGPGNVCTAN
jgi:hypothetical protein